MKLSEIHERLSKIKKETGYGCSIDIEICTFSENGICIKSFDTYTQKVTNHNSIEDAINHINHQITGEVVDSDVDDSDSLESMGFGVTPPVTGIKWKNIRS